ncbi:hypothetical protein H0I68_16975 [Yersinia kristensenii]|nr:hypothetical protein [Yersinia kristensenii]MBW5826735.1 hypothetical protein [Yersinia kristensenii]
MHKFLLALTPAILLLSAGTQAASNGEIEITASVVAGTVMLLYPETLWI